MNHNTEIWSLTSVFWFSQFLKICKVCKRQRKERVREVGGSLVSCDENNDDGMEVEVEERRNKVTYNYNVFCLIRGGWFLLEGRK